MKELLKKLIEQNEKIIAQNKKIITFLVRLNHRGRGHAETLALIKIAGDDYLAKDYCHPEA